LLVVDDQDPRSRGPCPAQLSPGDAHAMPSANPAPMNLQAASKLTPGRMSGQCPIHDKAVINRTNRQVNGSAVDVEDDSPVILLEPAGVASYRLGARIVPVAERGRAVKVIRSGRRSVWTTLVVALSVLALLAPACAKNRSSG